MNPFFVHAKGRRVVTAHQIGDRVVERELSVTEARRLANQLVEAACVADSRPLEPGEVIREVTGGK